MASTISEICPLSDKDCFLIVERHKTQFTYPLHRHREYELNFIQNGAGVERTVGNSKSVISDAELVLVGGEDLEHVWTQGTCRSRDIREITIQFSPDLLSDELLSKNQFSSIKAMLEKSRRGIAFPLPAIMSVYSMLDGIATQKDPFIQFLGILDILYTLSKFDADTLATSPKACEEDESGSGRIRKVNDFISNHYTEDITLEDLAEHVGLTPTSLSRLYRQKTGETISNHVIDTRLGHAVRDLVNTDRNIADICFSCGFNNLSNFNRIFKSRHGMSPKEFRQVYSKSSAII
ncbi:MAG: AraC family transcriptional regulator [Bacteroidales bacterium]|nr:AraC family transcriptional regulator [Bacteroidales bacterium]